MWVLNTYLQGNKLNSNLILAGEHDNYHTADLQQLNQWKTELVAITKSEGFTAGYYFHLLFFSKQDPTSLAWFFPDTDAFIFKL